MSAVVHLDEDTPHMHLVFVPVIHTKDKEGKEIEKICARDFWKGRDSYRHLQNAFYEHVKSKDTLIKELHEENKILHQELSKQVYSLIRDFEKETRVSLDAEKQVQKEDIEKEMEWDYER